MSNGDIIVGKTPPVPTRKTVIVDPAGPAATEANSLAKAGHCGAMTQQRSNGGAISTPQKLVRLVGCHDVRTTPRRKD